MNLRNEHRIPEERNTVQMNRKDKTENHREWVLKSQKFKVIHQGM